MAPSTRIPNFYNQVIELAQEQRTNAFMGKLNLGGSSGGGGGAGSPPGGFLGQLRQTKVAYDSTEGATSSTGSTASLLDNLNHIRGRLASLEAGSGGGSATVGNGADFVQNEYSGGNISVGTAADGGWVDVDGANAALVIVPAASGSYQATFGFDFQSTWGAVGDLVVWFRLTDGSQSLAAIAVDRHNFGSLAVVSDAINLSGIFTWTSTNPRTVKLQRWIQLANNVTSSFILATGGPVLHMDILRLGGGSAIGDEAYERTWWGW